MELSIVIVNYRSWVRLSRCLISLKPLLESGPESVEVIVVDNASGDGTYPEFVKTHPGIRFVLNDANWGFADGCNLGAKGASGALLLFLNPDAEDARGGIATLLGETRSHPEAAIFTARQLDDQGRPQKVFDAFPSLLTLFGLARAVLRLASPGRYPDPRRPIDGYLEVDWVSGSALLIRRSVFEALGGFARGFWMYSEDVDLCRRARDARHRVAVVGQATLLHAHAGASRATPETTALTRSEVVVSRHYYAHRHFGRLHAAAYHSALILTRFLPDAIAALLSALRLGAARGIHVRARTAQHLAHYYRRVPSRGWRSLRSRS